MSLAIGTRLGPYEIASPLGQGGMGEVYRARDTKLKRQVAIKILPEAAGGDPERLVRFQREAEVLASLNHPNIAAIYGFEDSASIHALVMEFVEGPTLADRIATGVIPLDEALSIAKQIAEALEAAHEQGIIHRDLKPANIKVRENGAVKVLDFGLAKVFDPAPPSRLNLTDSPTLSLPVTYAGLILGTAAYMSPEQAAAKPIDKRADIWSFGVVFWEMLTGKQLFDGETISHTLADVLRADIDFNQLPPDTPPAISNLLRRCLDRDVKRRLRDIGEARITIDRVVVEPQSGPVTPTEAVSAAAGRHAHLWRVVPAALSGIVAAALVIALAWSMSPALTHRTVTRFSIALPEGQRFAITGGQIIAISPDGSHVAYVANQQLYIRSMSEREPKPVPGTENARLANPVFSPDGGSIAFYSDNGDARIGSFKRIAVGGGTPFPICTCTANSVSWSPDGIAFVRGDTLDLMRVPPNGGQAELLVSKKDGLIWNPQILPGGDAVLFGLAPGVMQTTGAPPDTWDNAQIVIQSLKSGERTVLPVTGAGARYVSTGHLVYVVASTLFAVPFDLAHRRVIGGAIPLIAGIGRPTIAGATPGTVYYGVSDTGTLVYVAGSVSRQLDLVYVDPKGTIEPLKLPPAIYQFPRVSPDGKHVAVGTDDGKEANVWTYDLSGTTAIRQVTLTGKNRFPIWSSDGRRLVFQSDREGDRAIFAQRADGSGPAERLTKPESGSAHVPQSWSPDGRTLLFTVSKDDKSTLWSLSLADKKAAPFGDAQSSTRDPITAVFSPTGQWLAYAVSDGNTRAIFVQPFPPTGDKFRIVSPAWAPLWSPDGDRLFFRTPGAREEFVRVTTKPTFVFSNPELAFAGVLQSRGNVEREYDIAADGKRFVAVLSAPDSTGPARVSQIEVVVNWSEELRQHVPVR